MWRRMTQGLEESRKAESGMSGVGHIYQWQVVDWSVSVSATKDWFENRNRAPKT